MEIIKRHIITALVLLLSSVFVNSETAFANSETALDNDNKAECDRYRNEIATIDSAIVQSYIAQVNKQRADNQVAQQTLRNQRQRTILLTSIVAGGLIVIALLVAGLLLLRRLNTRLKQSE